MPRLQSESVDADDARSSAYSEEETVVVAEPEPVSAKKSKGRPKKEKAANTPPEEEEEDEGDEEDDDDEEAEDVYVVERIINHKFEKNELQFHVRWKDYPDIKDHTWEPESNLETAHEILNEYIESVGGREALDNAPRPKKRGRQPSTNGKGTPSQERNGKRAKKESEELKQEESPGPKQTKLPPGNWEDVVDHIDTMDRQVAGLFVLLTFKDGTRIRQLASVVYKRCPQKMLQFYESHLSITPKSRTAEDSTNVEI